MDMEMEGGIVEQNQPRRRKTPMKNRASLDDELEFFMDLRSTLTKVKARFDSSNSNPNSDLQGIVSVVNWPAEQICGQTEADQDLPGNLQKNYEKIKERLGIVDRHINILRKHLGTIRVAHSIPYPTEMEIDIGKSLWEEEDILEPEPNSDDADSGGDEEEEDETDRGKSAMKEQEPRIGSKLKLELDAVAGTEADAGASEAAIFKSLVKPDPIPTNIMPKLDADDNHDPAADLEEEMDRVKSDADAQLAEMTAEEQTFTQYRSDWESSWSITSSSFRDMTALSPMQFTHVASGRKPYCAEAQTSLQIFTFKLAGIKDGITWPLSVYGVVAFRDAVDHNRNVLFCCDRDNAQKLTQDDPFLRLIGPSRAIVFADPVDVEVQLRVKDSMKSGDRALISQTCQYRRHRPGVYTIQFSNCFCKTELCLERVARSVQATILGIRVVEDKDELWPFKYGVQVACSPSTRRVEVTDSEIKYIPNPSSGEIVLLDSKDGTIPDDDSDGYLRLSRQVVSVQANGVLEVNVQAYSSSGSIAAQVKACFEAKSCNINHHSCYLNNAELEITVAWSLLVSDKQDIGADGWQFETGDTELELSGLELKQPIKPLSQYRSSV